ncbi:MAG: NtaA/DmoA family FMN-dependent monooxygenase [Bordetella sp.]|nr:NtaA/DmoA family FMN-dependent monooxygenase [Bordetella sp.]
MSDRRLILGVHLGISRRNAPLADTELNLDESLRIARLADEGGLDLIFRGDFIQFKKEAVNPDRPVFALDPLIETTALAAQTRRIGLVATLSTTFNVPYILARQLQTLDHISGGRVGWNAVTSFDGEGHFGLDVIPDQPERYRIAGEFIDILNELWSSWTPGSTYVGEDGLLKVDKKKIRDVDYRGTHRSSRGGLGVPRSRQGWPLQVQAGASSYGIAFAAQYAEAIFAAAPTAGHAERFYQAIHAAVHERGEGRRPPVILPALILTLADTAEAAQAKYARANAHINYASGVKALEGQLNGIRLDDLDLDEPVPLARFESQTGSEGRRRISRQQLYRELVEAGLTLRKILEIHSIGNTHHIFVGSYDEAAAYIRDWYEQRRADGFMVGFYGDEHGLENFLARVVPQLDDVRRPPTGPVTLRERLGVPVPA